VIKQPTSEIRRLNQLRLGSNLSYQAIADEVGIPMRTLYRLMTDTSQKRCYDRTLHKIREFLAKFPEPQPRRRRATPLTRSETSATR